MKILTYEEFNQVELRSGTIIKVEDFPRAKKPAFKIWVDFGNEFGILQTSAQVTIYYNKDNLLGKSVVGCINLGEKNIAGFISQFLLLGFVDDSNAICLITTDQKIPNGKKLC